MPRLRPIDQLTLHACMGDLIRIVYEDSHERAGYLAKKWIVRRDYVEYLFTHTPDLIESIKANIASEDFRVSLADNCSYEILKKAKQKRRK